MGSQIFYPQHRAGAAVHYQVCPLVNELYVAEWCLWEERQERQYPDENETRNGKGVLPYKLIAIFHVFYVFGCKSKK